MFVADTPTPPPTATMHACPLPPAVTSLHGLYCVIIPWLPFSSMKGYERGGSGPYMWHALPQAC